MKNKCRVQFASLSTVLVAALACAGIAGCGGGGSSGTQSGSSSVAQGGTTGSPTPTGVDFTMSSSYSTTANATFAGGFLGQVTLQRANTSSTVPASWQLTPNVGTITTLNALGVAQGDGVDYFPPAPSALQVPTNLAIGATIGTFQHAYNIAVFPAIWKQPAAAGNWGSLTVTGATKPANFAATLAPNDYPQADPIPNFNTYGWMVLPNVLQPTGPDNLYPGQYLPTAGKGTFITAQLQTGGWMVSIRVDNALGSTSPQYTGQVTCNALSPCTGMNLTANLSNVTFTNVQVPLDQGGAVVLNGSLAVNVQPAQTGTTATAASLQLCPKTWATQTGAAALASLSCVNGTYNGVNPSGNGQCSVVINTAANSVSFTSEGSTETMPIPNNSSTGTVVLGYNPGDPNNTSYVFHNQYAVALDTLPQGGGGTSNDQRMLFTFGNQNSVSSGQSASGYQLDFSYTRASSATANPSVAKYCRIILPS